jgi:ABC-type transporter Mla subunit MlaD
MKKDRNAFKAGLFIVVAIILAVAIVVSIKGVGLAESRDTRAVAFKFSDDLGGLRVGDDVRVGGHKVGVIRSIEPVGLDGTEPRLLVTFTVPTKYRFRSDAVIGVQTTLTGSSALNITDLGRGTMLADNQVLDGTPDPKSSALASLGDAAPIVKAILRDVQDKTLPKANAAIDSFKHTGDASTELVQNVKGKVDPIVSKYEQVTDKTGAMMDSITGMVGPSQTDFKGTMANLNKITGDVKEKLPAMLTKLEGSVDGANKALADVQQTMANAKELSGSLKAVIGKNQGKLEGIIASVKAAGDNLKMASAEIRRSPWRLLYKPEAGEMANLNLYDSARQFAEGANDLNDASQALRDALNSKTADAQEVQRLVNRLEKSFGQFREVEGKLWSSVKK